VIDILYYKSYGRKESLMKGEKGGGKIIEKYERS